MSFTQPQGSIAPAAPPKRYKRSVGGSDFEGGLAVVLQPLQPQATAAAISRIRIRPGSRICGPGDIRFPSLVVETVVSELLFREIFCRGNTRRAAASARMAHNSLRGA